MRSGGMAAALIYGLGLKGRARGGAAERQESIPSEGPKIGAAKCNNATFQRVRGSAEAT